jgi:hypothetical protein
MQHPDPKEHHTPIVHYDGLTRPDRIKGKAKIMPCELQPYTHLKKHTLNELIGRVNEAQHVLLKKQNRYEEPQVYTLLKYFGIPVPKAQGCLVDLC